MLTLIEEMAVKLEESIVNIRYLDYNSFISEKNRLDLILTKLSKYRTRIGVSAITTTIIVEGDFKDSFELHHVHSPSREVEIRGAFYNLKDYLVERLIKLNHSELEKIYFLLS